MTNRDAQSRLRRYVLALDPAKDNEALAIVLLDTLLAQLSRDDEAITSDKFTAVCPKCGRVLGAYDKASKVAQALSSHLRQIRHEG